MDLLLAAMQHPFTWGLLAGLAFAAFQFIKSLELRTRIRSLEGQLVKGNEINLVTMTKLQEEVSQLKSANQNLRDKLAQISHSPRGAAANQLEAYQRAAETLTLKAPGFAQSWMIALQEAQDRIAAEIEGASKPRHGFLDALPFLRTKSRLPVPATSAEGSSGRDQSSPPSTPAN